LGVPNRQYRSSRTFLLTGNSSGSTAKIGETTENKTGKPDIGEDSKTVYISNDSSNLDAIPFDVENIIDEITEEDVE
jgi:hypothetical protein